MNPEYSVKEKQNGRKPENNPTCPRLPQAYFLADFVRSGVFGGLAIFMNASMETPTGLVRLLLKQEVAK